MAFKFADHFVGASFMFASDRNKMCNQSNDDPDNPGEVAK